MTKSKTTTSISDISTLEPTKDGEPITEETIRKAIEKAKNEFLIATKTEIQKQAQTDRASLITVFGIFASIISFLTIEFQFLRTICSFEKLVGFTLILASLLLCFNLALDYLVKSRTDKETPKPNLIFNISAVILFILGIIFINFGNEEKCKDNKIYEKYSEEFKNQQTEFNQNYTIEQNKKYNEIKSKIEIIEKAIE